MDDITTAMNDYQLLMIAASDIRCKGISLARAFEFIPYLFGLSGTVGVMLSNIVAGCIRAAARDVLSDDPEAIARKADEKKELEAVAQKWLKSRGCL